MTLKEVILTINRIADSQPNVNTIIKSGDIYDLNTLGDVKYAAFCASQQPHTQDEGFITYNFYLYYVDRLLSDASNKIDIQSTGIQVLSNIMRTLEYELDADFSNVVYQTFTQSFESLCAGAYVSVGITVPIESLCAELF